MDDSGGLGYRQELNVPILRTNDNEDGQQQGQEYTAPKITSREFDSFFSKAYAFYQRKGLVPIILHETTSLLNLLFVGLCTSFICFIDVSKIMRNCSAESTCEGNLRDYVSYGLHEFSPLSRLATVAYILLFAAFFFVRCSESVSIILDAFFMDSFFMETLNFRPGQIEKCAWNDIVNQIMALHEQGLCLMDSKATIDELEITMRIMRKENYFIALINRDVLDLRVPWYFSLILRADKVHLTQGLEWCLCYCIIDSIHNEHLNLSSAFLNDKDGLARKFVLVGCVNLLLLPFILVIMTAQFFLSNAQQSASSHIFDRRWTSLALWKFREYNELSEGFEARIKLAHEPADQFMRACAKSRNLAIVARCVQFISGAVVALLLLCSVLREEALLYIHLGSHNLLWWLGLFTSIYLGSRSYVRGDVSDAEHAAMGYRTFANWHDLPRTPKPNALIEIIMSHTHHYPRHWRVGSVEAVKDELETLFPQKIQIFFYEILSVILTPIILIFSLPPCAPRVIAFIRQHTTYVDGMGAVLDYALFDFEKYGGAGSGGGSGKEADQSNPQAPQAAAASDNSNNKLEKSFLSFRQNNPGWRHQGGGGDALIDRVSSFRETVERSRAKEGESDECFYSCLLAKSGFNAKSAAARMRHSHSHSHSHSHLGVGPQSLSRLSQSVQLTRSRVGWGGEDLRVPSPLGRDGEEDGAGYPLLGNSPASPNLKPNLDEGMRTLLLSVLRDENIDYENDHYWLNNFLSSQREL